MAARLELCDGGRAVTGKITCPRAPGVAWRGCSLIHSVVCLHCIADFVATEAKLGLEFVAGAYLTYVDDNGQTLDFVAMLQVCADIPQE